MARLQAQFVRPRLQFSDRQLNRLTAEASQSLVQPSHRSRPVFEGIIICNETEDARFGLHTAERITNWPLRLGRLRG